jgi:bifunctional DNase/RNase
MAALLKAGDLQLERVVIHAIEDSTFRAVLKLKAAGAEASPSPEGIEIDARPSDAIALALRTHSSIWMLEEVVADASIPVDAEADAQEQDSFRRFLDNTSPAELIRRLGKSQPPGEPPTEDSPNPSDNADPGTNDPGANV